MMTMKNFKFILLVLLIPILFSLKINTEYDKIIYEYRVDNQFIATSLKREHLNCLTEDDIEIRVSIVFNYKNIQTFLDSSNMNYEDSINFEEMNSYCVNLLDLEYDDIFISRYTTYVFLSYDEFSYTDIDNIIINSSNENINEVYISEELEINYDMDYEIDDNEYSSYIDYLEVNNNIQSLDYRNIPYDNFPNGTSYTGDNVRIGIFDIGIFDLAHPNFEGITVQNVTSDYNGNYPSNKNHPTLVASVLGGKYGIANKADLFFADFNADDGFPTIERLLDVNVDVINMSIAYGGTGYANTFDYSIFKYLESIIYSTDVIMVGATGNDLIYSEATANVAQPANTTSVISVGSIRQDGTPSNFSNYRRFNSIDVSKSKPEIVAVGENRNVNGFGSLSGTSFSAPAVTETIALLIEKYGNLINSQTAMAVLTATTSDDVDKSQTIIDGEVVTNYRKTGGYLYERTGAGRLDIMKALNYPSTNLRANITKENLLKTLYLEKGDSITISFTWNRTFHPYDWHINNIDRDSITLVKFQNADLYLKFNGVNVASSKYRYTNIQFIRYTIPTTGTYSIYTTGAESAQVGSEFNYAYQISHICSNPIPKNEIFHIYLCCGIDEPHTFHYENYVFICSKCYYISTVPPVEPWSIKEDIIN